MSGSMSRAFWQCCPIQELSGAPDRAGSEAGLEWQSWKQDVPSCPCLPWQLGNPRRAGLGRDLWSRGHRDTSRWVWKKREKSVGSFFPRIILPWLSLPHLSSEADFLQAHSSPKNLRLIPPALERIIFLSRVLSLSSSPGF